FDDNGYIGVVATNCEQTYHRYLPPGDIISVTYVDASGRSRTQHNVYIPWSMTVTPISTSDVGSVQASSLFRVSRLNCSITTSDGTVLSSNNSDAPQTSC
ncbi:MmpS family transport accessory protein, partial [Mycobacterium alsense]|uniref:MmpS family transport accessory protein n=1 Tax=Mycobacterium alsense TaxID=324058 RepID=UPI001F6205AB